MAIAPKVVLKNPLNDVTDEAIEKLQRTLAESAVVAHKKASKLKEILEKCRPMIEANHKRGNSWPYIAMLINRDLGTRIHHATVRSYIMPKKAKLTAADVAQGATDMSGMAAEAAADAGAGMMS